MRCIAFVQFGPGFNSNGPWYNMEGFAAATHSALWHRQRGSPPHVTVFACYPPAKWGRAMFETKQPFFGLEPILPQKYKNAAEVKAVAGQNPAVRMHRFRPVYMAMQLSWMDGTTPRHRCVLGENAQRRDKDRNTDRDGKKDPNLVHAALPLPLSKGKKSDSKLRKWIMAHNKNLDQNVPALGYYGLNTKDYGLEGKCFEENVGAAASAPSHCNTFKAIHDPGSRCQPDGAGASQHYRPISDHDTMFKNKPNIPGGGTYATWADYCDAQFTEITKRTTGSKRKTRPGADPKDSDTPAAAENPLNRRRVRARTRSYTAGAGRGAGAGADMDLSDD